MRESIDLLRSEPRARVFFAVLTQSALGTGAGYIALLLIARDRFDSPWAVTLVLLADVVPAMLLGPVFGAAADRWSRRWCTVAADVMRAVAFGGVALVGSFEATVGFALLAGIGTGLFTPSALAALPSLVDEPRRVPATTSLYGAIADLGFTAGPAMAAAFLLFVGSAEAITAVNAVSFGASAVVLTFLRFGAAPVLVGDPERRRSLAREAREGVRTVSRLSGIRAILVASSAALFCAGLFNVGELFFATEDLKASEAGFSVLVTLFGVGFIVGSLSGSQGGTLPELKRSYLIGLAAMGGGLLATGLAPVFGVALATFALAGFGNGVVLVYERLLIQRTVSDELTGRVFGIKDSMASWAFAIAFLAAGAAISLVGTRALLIVAGGIGIAVWAASAVLLRDTWNTDDAAVEERELEGGPHVGAGGAVGQHGPDVVRG